MAAQLGGAPRRRCPAGRASCLCPPSRRRLRLRGFDPAALLARALGAARGLQSRRACAARVARVPAGAAWARRSARPDRAARRAPPRRARCARRRRPHDRGDAARLRRSRCAGARARRACARSPMRGPCEIAAEVAAPIGIGDAHPPTRGVPCGSRSRAATSRSPTSFASVERRFEKVGGRSPSSPCEVELSRGAQPGEPGLPGRRGRPSPQGQHAERQEHAADMAHAINLAADDLARQVKRHRDEARRAARDRATAADRMIAAEAPGGLEDRRSGGLKASESGVGAGRIAAPAVPLDSDAWVSSTGAAASARRKQFGSTRSASTRSADFEPELELTRRRRAARAHGRARASRPGRARARSTTCSPSRSRSSARPAAGRWGCATSTCS